MTAAVTGATGYVGRFIVERLVDEGVAVRAWRRKSSDMSGLPGAVQWVEGELGAPETHAALIKGADMLVHSALDHVPGNFRRGEGPDLGRYLRINVGESLALLAAARDAGVRRCVFLSSRAVFGAWPSGGRLADTDPVRPDTIYGASKAALEAFVQNWGVSDGWAITALRPTGVYGVTVPAEKSKWYEIVRKALRREDVEARIGTEVHGRDVAQAVWRLLNADLETVAGRMFNCSDLVISTRDIVRAVHRLAGIDGPVPEELPQPENVMDCAGLRALGVTFGGWPLFEKTVAELTAAAGHDVA